MTAVFHRIGNSGAFTNHIEDILAYDCQPTFDGIYTTVFDHRLQLRSRPAILFISGDQVGREGFCNKEQLLELKKDGHTLAWHGWNHRRLTEMTEAEIRAELSKPDWVEPIYAYPHGDFNDLSKKILEEMGYEKAYSTTQGDNSNYAIYRKYV